MPGDSFGCYNWGGVVCMSSWHLVGRYLAAKDAAKYPVMHSTDHTTEDYPAQRQQCPG